MSSVIRPAGPLPQRVYWVRRVLLLAVVVLVMTVIWSLVGRITGGADQASGADGATTGGSGPSQTDPGDNTGGTGNSGAGGTGSNGGGSGGSGQNQGGSKGDGPDDKGGHKQHQHNKPTLAAPTGDCQPSDVAMRVEVDDSKSGLSLPIGLVLKSLATPACTLAITPETLVLRITSGDDVIWSSGDCPDELLAKEIVVRRQPATTYTFDWDGHRSTDSCSAPGNVATPGGYWAEAALIGAEAHKGYFDIR